MKLTQAQFDILTQLESDEQIKTQRDLALELKKSVGYVNKHISDLVKMGLVCDGKITGEGMKALEPFRVRRAVFIAAGMGSRLIPITLNTPKPLIRVNGVRIVDTLLDAVIKAGINEIYLVRGYLSEQFDQLIYKYPNIKFIENPAYNESNNISSVMCARDLLENAYVFEADLFVYNPAVITKYQYSSNYLGVPVKTTDDWCFKSVGGTITRLCIGGVDCHHMFGISYWNQMDGARLADHVAKVYAMPGGKERYWDQVPLEYYIKDYKVAVRECSFDDLVEIDTYRELKELDATYI